MELNIKQTLKVIADSQQLEGYKGLLNIYNLTNPNKKIAYETFMKALTNNSIKYQTVKDILNAINFKLVIMDDKDNIF